MGSCSKVNIHLTMKVIIKPSCFWFGLGEQCRFRNICRLPFHALGIGLTKQFLRKSSQTCCGQGKFSFPQT